MLHNLYHFTINNHKRVEELITIMIFKATQTVFFSQTSQTVCRTVFLLIKTPPQQSLQIYSMCKGRMLTRTGIEKKRTKNAN